MNENDDLARIVLAEGFCTREQIDRCRKIQSSTDERLSLGQSLLREGFVTQEQYSRALFLLRRGTKNAGARQSQEDRVLGGIVVAEGWISAKELKACLDESTTSGRPLAETLVTVGHLEPARVEAILGRLERLKLSCPSCKAVLSVVRLPTEESVRCPRCGNPVSQEAR